MADAQLAGLPRISRAFDEIRMRGWLALALAAAAGGWWLVQWLLDQRLAPERTALIALAVAVVAVHLAWLNVRRRLREGLKDVSAPSPRIVFETRADGGMRRMRLSGAVFLTAMVVLVFDGLGEWQGISAGVVAGVSVAVGALDLWEARLWRRAERERDSELYVLVRADALVSTYGVPRVYEVPRDSRRPQQHAVDAWGERETYFVRIVTADTFGARHQMCHTLPGRELGSRSGPDLPIRIGTL